MTEPAYLVSDARFSADRKYRYSLTRTWARVKPTIAFIMLNPSTADETKLDPTVRRCVGFAQAWGYGGIEVGNLFALRSTDPSALKGHPDPIGEDNDEYLLGILDSNDATICAWGNGGRWYGQGKAVKLLLQKYGPLYHLGLTKAGEPKHPLYLRADTKMEVWE